MTNSRAKIEEIQMPNNNTPQESNVCPTCHGEGYTSQYHDFPCHTCKGTGRKQPNPAQESNVCTSGCVNGQVVVGYDGYHDLEDCPDCTGRKSEPVTRGDL